jgi:RNA-directed DNA polymerase
VISPLLANCYFRRFLLAWHSHGHRDQLNAHVVNYADDFVICCRPGNAEAAMTRMAKLVTRLGLEVNATKTRIVRLPEEQFDFLGYTVGRFYGKDGPSLLRHSSIEEGGKELAPAYPRADCASVVSGRTGQHGGSHQQHATRLVRLL